ncbi:hypothetical protein K431DRAFT_73745 [Polychaeton citri CBS 116435]|uniref:Transcription regulator Rua1 C-terminal domain-containing protein n=1 Tax=Polychaeton citri CBS 116435 TaxID=1314669 RepID=A0A9P4UQM1_9PEZI|nr:hypothetical protein K431DRAFT_73745 [Polychaeton citri CBS 116435]
MDWHNCDYRSQQGWDQEQDLEQDHNQHRSQWFQQTITQSAQTTTFDGHESYEGSAPALLNSPVQSQQASHSGMIPEHNSHIYNGFPILPVLHQPMPSMNTYPEPWYPAWPQEQPMANVTTTPDIKEEPTVPDSTLGAEAQTYRTYASNENEVLAGASRDAARLSTTPTQPPPPPVFDSNPTRTEPPQRDLDGSPVPKEQSPRFPHDIYTARWVRGESTKRQGWCGYCQTWLELKNSTYWYHLHYSHGISCTTGKLMEPPLHLRLRNNSWDAYCAACQDWVSLGSGEKGRTSYYRHIYKCQEKPRSGSRSSSRLNS